MKRKYSYAIIKYNNPYFERESVLDPDGNNYRNTKYAMFVKGVHGDGSESVYFIVYNSNLEKLQEMANNYPSWYNYPMGLYREMQGNILELS